MKALEGRIEALERARKRPLPLFTLTLENGAERRLDALDAHLYLARMKAGVEPQIIAAARISGALPGAGTIWADLLSEISNISLSRKGV